MVHVVWAVHMVRVVAVVRGGVRPEKSLLACTSCGGQIAVSQSATHANNHVSWLRTKSFTASAFERVTFIA